jgi:hypothetical protein
MKSPIQLVIVAVVFAISVALNMLVLERGGSIANYVFLYGLSGSFTLNGKLTLFSGVIGAIGFLTALVLRRLKLSPSTFRMHLTLVSMYMYGIALAAILMMAVFPTVHFR